MLVDAHCHLTGSYLGEEQLEGVLERAARAGVSGFMAVGTDLDDSTLVLALARRNPRIRASLGIHPHEARTWGPLTGEALEVLVSDPAVRFVGETGLDWEPMKSACSSS